MKFNISYPIAGTQKCIVIDDDKKVSCFYDKRMGNEVEGGELDDQFKGYTFKITGGNDKDGFPMKQGVMVKGRVRLLLSKGHSTYRPRRAGERKRKSVRGCIVGPDLAVVSLAITKVGDSPIEGLTDDKKPRRLGPKRANHIRKLFNLKKEDDVRLYVVRRKIEKEGKKPRVKAPKIQRLITDVRLRRKRVYKAEKKARWERTKKAMSDYQKVVTEYKKKKAAEAAKAHEEKTTGKNAPVEAAPAKGAKTATTTKTATKVDAKNAPAQKVDAKTAATKKAAPTQAAAVDPKKATGKPATQPATTQPAAGKKTTKK